MAAIRVAYGALVAFGVFALLARPAAADVSNCAMTCEGTHYNNATLLAVCTTNCEVGSLHSQDTEHSITGKLMICHPTTCAKLVTFSSHGCRDSYHAITKAARVSLRASACTSGMPQACATTAPPVNGCSVNFATSEYPENKVRLVIEPHRPMHAASPASTIDRLRRFGVS